jgi:hypothetical protein
VKAKNADETLIATYAYDGPRRRIKKVVEGGPDVTYHYYWDEQWRLLEVRKVATRIGQSGAR